MKMNIKTTLLGDKEVRTLSHVQRLRLLEYVSPFFGNFESNNENDYYDAVSASKRDKGWWLIGRDKVTIEKTPWWFPGTEGYNKVKVETGKHGKVANVKQLARLDALIIKCAAQVNSILADGIKEYYSDE